MSLKSINLRTIVLILIVVATTAMRLVSFKFPFLSNFTPVGAIALFGGAYFNPKWKAYVVVLLSMFFSDILINYMYNGQWVLFYAGSLWLYGCFAIMVFIGSLIKKVNVVNVGFASFASILIHWLIMDLPWLYGTLYPHTLKGYISSLAAAVPFEMNMVYGDLLFGAILFGGFELAKTRYSALRSQKELAV